MLILDLALKGMLIIDQIQVKSRMLSTQGEYFLELE